MTVENLIKKLEKIRENKGNVEIDISSSPFEIWYASDIYFDEEKKRICIH